jgi:flagellar hook-basal body complex protein FliE
VQTIGNDINIDLGGIVMNGVNNPEEFQQQLISAFQNSSKVQKVARAATTDLLAGGSRLGVNRIR